MSIYQKHYPFRGIVYTSSPAINNYAVNIKLQLRKIFKEMNLMYHSYR